LSMMIGYDGLREGFVHSVETGGMVDGPGIRYVVFLSGCGLRCLYCHNPDTWRTDGGQLVTVTDVIRDIKKYRSYLTCSGGGVTVTGGEPFAQPAFLAELLAACKDNGFHTVLDTSGYTDRRNAESALKYTDLLLLDIKSINPDTYKELTGVNIDRTLEFLRLSDFMEIPTWIRFVLVPGYTDNFDDIQNMADFLKPFDNIEKIEVLPFHKLGEFKWGDLNIPYQLTDTAPPSQKILERAKSILEV